MPFLLEMRRFHPVIFQYFKIIIYHRNNENKFSEGIKVHLTKSKIYESNGNGYFKGYQKLFRILVAAIIFLYVISGTDEKYMIGKISIRNQIKVAFWISSNIAIAKSKSTHIAIAFKSENEQ